MGVTMKATGYAIQWLYGEFRMARYVRGKPVEQYASDTLVETPADFVNALREARTHIDFKRKGKVSVVHEHDLHTHTFMEVPQMRERDLEKYLQRRVDQESAKHGEQVWCYHGARHRDGSEGVLLHMLPKRLVDTTIVSCTAMGLIPKRYVPLTEIINNYMPRFGYHATDVVLIVALFTQRAEIVVGYGSGEMILVRELGFGTRHGFQERLAVDINRTARYARQHTGKKVKEVRVIGAYPDDVLESLSENVEIDISTDPDSNDPWFWMNRGAQLPAKLSANYISIFAQRNITRESIRRMGVWVLMGLLVCTTAVTAAITREVAISRADIQEALDANENLDFLIENMESRISMTEKKLGRLQRLQSNSANMPSIFLLHLSSLTPATLRLTDVEVANSGGEWNVSIRGEAADALENIPTNLAWFENRLQSSPWNMGITQSWKHTWYDQLQNGVLRDGAPARFELHGVLR